MHDLSPHCLNCNADLVGGWCHACGQKAASTRLAMHDVVHDATHEFLHLDGKIFRTVRLLATKPGELTREFLAGRRVAFISPFRLYLTFSLIFFTLAAVLPDSAPRVVRMSREGKELNQDTAFKRQLSRGLKEVERDGRHVSEQVMHNVPKAMFLLMPLFGLITWAFYRRQERYYIPHLYYSIHFHAFVFLVMTLYILAARLALPRQAAALIILTTIPYHLVALRRVFGGSRKMTIAKGTAIGILYWLAVLAAMLTITFLVVMRAGAAG